MTSTTALAQQKTRTFNRFSQAEDEVVDARVFSGIHYRHTDNVSRRVGRHVARWVFENYFQPICDRQHGDHRWEGMHPCDARERRP